MIPKRPLANLQKEMAAATYLNGIQRELSQLKAQNADLMEKNRQLTLAKAEAHRVLLHLANKLPVRLFARSARKQAIATAS